MEFRGTIKKTDAAWSARPILSLENGIVVIIVFSLCIIDCVTFDRHATWILKAQALLIDHKSVWRNETTYFSYLMSIENVHWKIFFTLTSVAKEWSEKVLLSLRRNLLQFQSEKVRLNKSENIFSDISMADSFMGLVTQIFRICICLVYTHIYIYGLWTTWRVWCKVGSKVYLNW